MDTVIRRTSRTLNIRRARAKVVPLYGRRHMSHCRSYHVLKVHGACHRCSHGTTCIWLFRWCDYWDRELWGPFNIFVDSLGASSLHGSANKSPYCRYLRNLGYLVNELATWLWIRTILDYPRPSNVRGCSACHWDDKMVSSFH